MEIVWCSRVSCSRLRSLPSKLLCPAVFKKKKKHSQAFGHQALLQVWLVIFVLSTLIFVSDIIYKRCSQHCLPLPSVSNTTNYVYSESIVQLDIHYAIITWLPSYPYCVLILFEFIYSIKICDRVWDRSVQSSWTEVPVINWIFDLRNHLISPQILIFGFKN